MEEFHGEEEAIHKLQDVQIVFPIKPFKTIEITTSINPKNRQYPETRLLFLIILEGSLNNSHPEICRQWWYLRNSSWSKFNLVRKEKL